MLKRVMLFGLLGVMTLAVVACAPPPEPPPAEEEEAAPPPPPRPAGHASRRFVTSNVVSVVDAHGCEKGIKRKASRHQDQNPKRKRGAVESAGYVVDRRTLPESAVTCSSAGPLVVHAHRIRTSLFHPPRARA